MRVGEDRARDREPLPLAAGERHAALAEHRLVALGEPLDELGRAGEPRRSTDLLVAGVGCAELEVAADRVAEQERLFKDEADAAAQLLQLDLADVDAADRHAAAVGVVEAREQRSRRRLARAGGADERERRALRNLERQPVEDRTLAAVAEADVLEPHVAPRRKRQRVRRLDDGGLCLQHVDDAPGRRDRALHRADALAERAQRGDERREVDVEERERPDRDVAVDHAVAPVPERDEDPGERQCLERRQEHRVDRGDAERAVDNAARLAAEPCGERVAGADPLDHADAGDRLLGELRQVAEILLVHLGPFGVPARVAAEADADERERGEHRDREPPVDDEQHGGDADHREDVAERVADRVEEARDERRVVRGARDEVAGADPVVVARVEHEGAAEDPVAHGGVGVRVVADREDVAEAAARRLDRAERGDAGARPPERALPVLDDARVDRVADEERRGDRRSLPGEAAEPGADDRPAEAARDRPQIAPPCVHTSIM